MTNTVGVFYIIVMSLVFSLMLPWWTIAVPCFLVGMLTVDRSLQAFLIGFVAIFILWLLTCLYIGMFSVSSLDMMVAEIFSIPSPYLLAVITAVTGGLVGGFACLSGTLLRLALNI